MTSPFDRSIEIRELTSEAAAFASHHGPPGSPAYRAAWLRFRQQIRTTEDLRRWRSAPRAANVLEILDAALKRAMQIDGAAMGNVQVYDRHLSALRLVAQHGFRAEFFEFFRFVDDATTACGVALASGSPVWVSDITRSPVFAERDALEVMLRAGSRAVASLPVRSATGRVTAMISMHYTRPTQWTGSRRLALERLSDSTARLLQHGARNGPSRADGC